MSKSGSGPPSRPGGNLHDSELLRIMVTYIVVFFMLLALMASSNSKDSIMVMTGITITYLLVCGAFDYLWMRYYLVENRESNRTNDRDMFHNILHMMLPGVVLILGYCFILTAFASSLNTSDVKSLILFIIKLISLIIIIIAYIFYTVKLMNILNDDKRKSRENDTQVDILYSILHPIAILLISGLFYVLILLFINRSSGGPSAVHLQNVAYPHKPI